MKSILDLFKKLGGNGKRLEEIYEQEEQELKSKKEDFDKNRKIRYAKLQKENKSKGIEYEKFVATHFENQNFIVKYNGIEKGKKDNSIDLIAISKEKIILIQCKNWKENSKYKINHEKIKAFVGDTFTYIEKNPIYKDYQVDRLFVVSNRILDSSAIKYIKENKSVVRYKLLPFCDVKKAA